MTHFKLSAASLAAAVLFAAGAATAAPSLLLRQPSVSADALVFVFGGDLWRSDRQGQNPVQLTSQAAAEFAPHISPDGKLIAFSAAYDGNTDVYVMPIEGGAPKRLTFHPGADVVNGWSADGKRVLFASAREIANSRSNQLYEVALTGGFERKVMEAVAYEGTWSADGTRLAYRPYKQAYNGASGWRQHRGGTTTPIWIIDPLTQKFEAVPHVNATDTNPIWAGAELVFISDRADGAANLFAYSPATKVLRQLTHETQWDVKNASAIGNTVVYESGGQLKELDTVTGKGRNIDVTLNPAAPQARVQWKDASPAITSAQLSATGKRVLVSARGEVFNVPVKDGSIRNMTNTSGVREKDALWSADGLRVAYISDAGRSHHLVLEGADGLDKPKTLSLGGSGYFSLLAWSPDSKRLIVQDNHLNLYSVNVADGARRLIATSARRAAFNVAFSADSRWLAYTVTGANHLGQIRLQDLDTGRDQALTDGLTHADSPVFAHSKDSGDLLYFTASINAGPTRVGLDMSTQERPLRSGLFVAVLSVDGKSPLLAKGGDEEAAKDDEKKGGKKAEKKDDKVDSKHAKPVQIDFDGLPQRIVGLPVAERNYDGLAVAADGALFYLEHTQPGISNEPPEAEGDDDATLYRFDFEAREAKSLKVGIKDFGLSADGKKALIRYAKGKLEIADADEKLAPKPIELGQLRMRVNPREEWQQIFDETWAMEKEFFYDPKLHGLDWDAVYKRYQPLLAHVQRREDLNELLVEMIGELQVGHNRVGGGDVHKEPSAKVGLLGADFRVDDKGVYRIKTILRGDRWSPFLKAPLAAPGMGVKEGDALLAINGHPLDGATNLFALLENTVDKQTVLTLSSDPTLKVTRRVTVEPVASEQRLRQWAWIERNRQYVDQQSGGKVAYVYLPDTAGEGYEHFNRMFFAQIDKQAVIVDDRRNSGGQAANYVTDVLRRPYLSSWKDRDGLIYDTPGGAIYGPKAMLIDQDAGSGGDFLPYAFKRLELGPLIGKRTWGGLIGIAANPPLIDGGGLVVPFFRFFTPEGQWRVENEGVAPDIDVELDPLGVNKGRDSQLDAAIGNVMERLKTYKPVQRTTAPAMPTKLGE
jgi:tricorn protease